MPVLYMVVLAGVVGSGKSTISAEIATRDPSFEIVNQDSLGNRQACERACFDALRRHKNVVIDRQNFDAQQRATWLAIAGEVTLVDPSLSVVVGCLVLDSDDDTLRERLRLRTGHPTVPTYELGAQLLDKFRRLWQEPRLDEGFDALLRVKDLSPERVEEALRSLWALKRTTGQGEYRRRLLGRGRLEWKHQREEQSRARPPRREAIP